MGGPDMAPHTPQRSERLGVAESLLWSALDWEVRRRHTTETYDLRAFWGASAMLTAMLIPRAFVSSFAVAAIFAVVTSGCIAMRPGVEQRTPQGPTAETMFKLRSVAMNGREPNFNERVQWDTAMEQKITEYLRKHPEKANALNISTFRFVRQVTTGMDQEQVLILLGPPVEVSESQARMEQVARRYWPQIQGNATMVWVYLEGWAIYFAGQNVVDITQYLPPG
jgi:hypothetical protein